MTRKGLIVTIISAIIMIGLTIKWTEVMSIIIILSIFGIIAFVTIEKSNHEVEE